MVSTNDCKQFNLNPTKNPVTKRKIKKSGAVYKKLEKDCNKSPSRTTPVRRRRKKSVSKSPSRTTPVRRRRKKSVSKSPSRTTPVRRRRKKSVSKSPSRTTPVRRRRKKSVSKFPSKVEVILSSKSCERSPVRRSAVRSPVRRSAVRSPVRRSAVRSPVRRSAVRSPVRRSAVRSPVRRSAVRSPMIKRNFTNEECAIWERNKTINPRTKKNIKVWGPVYRELHSACTKINKTYVERPSRSSTRKSGYSTDDTYRRNSTNRTTPPLLNVDDTYRRNSTNTLEKLTTSPRRSVPKKSRAKKSVTVLKKTTKSKKPLISDDLSFVTANTTLSNNSDQTNVWSEFLNNM